MACTSTTRAISRNRASPSRTRTRPAAAAAGRLSRSSRLDCSTDSFSEARVPRGPRFLSEVGLRALDIAVIVAYCVAVAAVGVFLSGRQQDSTDYFLGRRGLPWWAILLSIVATETSALTVISVPGLAATTNLTFIQLGFGYLVGRIGVAFLLLPGYFEGTQDTAYQRLERRFGPKARRTASAVFLVTRSLADCVRIFATAIPLAIITQWSLPVGIVAIGFVTLVYTWVGGLRAVVWVDVIQLGVYLLGGIATLIVATHLAGGIGAFGRAWDAGNLPRSTLGRPSKSYTRSGAAWWV